MEPNNDELISSFFEIDALDSDTFLKVKETLTRIGIAGREQGSNKPTLWQSCHILHKRGHYYIVHFKQLFLLDGRDQFTTFTDEDYDRTEYVVALLEEWGLVKPLFVVEKIKVDLVVIPFSKKDQWNLKSKYRIGVKKVYKNG